MDTGEFVNGESLESGAKVQRMTLCYIAVVSVLPTGLYSAFGKSLCTYKRC
jgi:hypothetical protein